MDKAAFWQREGTTWPNHQFSRFVRAGHLRWHVQMAGTGPVLILVHGTGASTHSWRHMLPLLAQRFTVVAADLPGHGFTEPAGGAGCSLEGMSESHSRLLEALQLEPVFCAGHSAGAAILCRMALDGRLAARAIVSINGAFMPFGGGAGVVFAPLARLFSRAPFVSQLIAWGAGDPAAVARVLDSTGSKLDAEGLALYVRLVREPSHVAGALCMMSHWNLAGLEGRLRRLTQPLTLIVGEEDRTVPPAQGRDLLPKLNGGTLLELPGLGHLAHEEQPQKFSELLMQIFR